MSNLVVTTSYGPAVALDPAKKIAAGAVGRSQQEQLARGHRHRRYARLPQVHEMMDDTQTASATVAVEKARTAAMFRRPTKMFEEAVAGGRNAILGMGGITPIEGGLPIVVNGKCVGAVGVGSLTSPQDAQVESGRPRLAG